MKCMTEELPGNSWEDSHQKRERLLSALMVAFGEVRHAYEVATKDIDFLDKYDEEQRVISEKIKALELKDDELTEEGRKLNEQYAKIKDGADDEAFNDLIDRSAENSHKQLDIRNQISDLYKQSDILNENFAGMLGDFKGSDAVMQQKVAKLDEIIRQLRELDAGL